MAVSKQVFLGVLHIYGLFLMYSFMFKFEGNQSCTDGNWKHTSPYMGKIPGGINNDRAVVLQGTVPVTAKSFIVNLKVGVFEGDDIAFHYNVGIGDATTLNSVYDGRWQTKECVPAKPFIRGGAFQMIIVVKSEGYEVYVNGSRHCTFKHCIPIARVTAIEIRGDVPELLCGSIYAIPYMGNIPGGLKKDMAVVIHGSIPALDRGPRQPHNETAPLSDKTGFYYDVQSRYMSVSEKFNTLSDLQASKILL
ncbi:Galectin-4 [Bagarius yarrelli]|uniref:Galectin n=1 Tax=Bagarius yarrelli TaxID=175774 RepID=A0A556U157_BAGYA|nr:Galectin-4 [Bagarius yarrelli]